MKGGGAFLLFLDPITLEQIHADLQLLIELLSYWFAFSIFASTVIAGFLLFALFRRRH